MNFCVGLLIITILTLKTSSSHPVHNNGNATKIRPGDYPFHCVIRMKPGNDESFLLCEGAVIDERWALTAAGCVDKYKSNPELLEVVAGIVSTENIKSEPHAQKRKVSKVNIHPSWFDSKKTAGDVALLELTRKFIFNKYVEKATFGKNATTNETAQLIGCGNSENLSSTNLTITSKKTCLEKNDNPSEFFCTNKKNSSYIFYDKSFAGAPLAILNTTSTRVIYAIFSTYRPHLFTNLTFHTNWIANVTKIEQSNTDNTTDESTTSMTHEKSSDSGGATESLNSTTTGTTKSDTDVEEDEDEVEDDDSSSESEESATPEEIDEDEVDDEDDNSDGTTESSNTCTTEEEDEIASDESSEESSTNALTDESTDETPSEESEEEITSEKPDESSEEEEEFSDESIETTTKTPESTSIAPSSTSTTGRASTSTSRSQPTTSRTTSASTSTTTSSSTRTSSSISTVSSSTQSTTTFKNDEDDEEDEYDDNDPDNTSTTTQPPSSTTESVLTTTTTSSSTTTSTSTNITTTIIPTPDDNNDEDYSDDDDDDPQSQKHHSDDTSKSEIDINPGNSAQDSNAVTSNSAQPLNPSLISLLASKANSLVGSMKSLKHFLASS